MNKIVQVVNAMISNSDKISNVKKNDKEYFFLYDNKHKWSIVRGNDEIYHIHFYPTDELNIDQLSHFNDWENYNLVTYSTNDIKTQEAIESFRELYQIVSNKVFGIDDIFDEIIGK
jgi:hypothetical protein